MGVGTCEDQSLGVGAWVARVGVVGMQGPEWGLGAVLYRGVGSGDVWGPEWGYMGTGLAVGEVHEARVRGRGMQGQSGVLGCGGARVRVGVHGAKWGSWRLGARVEPGGGAWG